MIETQLSSHSDGEQSKAFCRGGVSWESSGSLESPSSILRSRPEATTTVSSPIEVKSTFDSDEGSSDTQVVPESEALSNRLRDESSSVDLENQRTSTGCVTRETSYWVIPLVALYGILGCIGRVFIGRLFGADCDEGYETPDDIFSPFFSRVCVTTSGTTLQTGGALFLDLPANMLGCFLLGVITNPHSLNLPFPWLHPNHSFQRNKALIEGLRIGFCGTLTSCKCLTRHTSMYFNTFSFSYIFLLLNSRIMEHANGSYDGRHFHRVGTTGSHCFVWIRNWPVCSSFLIHYGVPHS